MSKPGYIRLRNLAEHVAWERVDRAIHLQGGKQKHIGVDELTVIFNIVAGKANGDGTSVRPSIATISLLSRKKPRTVQYAFQFFRQLGLLRIDESRPHRGGRRLPITYSIDIDVLESLPSLRDQRQLPLVTVVDGDRSAAQKPRTDIAETTHREKENHAPAIRKPRTSDQKTTHKAGAYNQPCGTGKTDHDDRSDVDIARSMFDEVAAELGLPPCEVLHEERRAKWQATLDTIGGVEAWRRMLSKISSSRWLLAQKPTVEFFIDHAKCTNVLEGKYDERSLKLNSAREPTDGGSKPEHWPHESWAKILKIWDDGGRKFWPAGNGPPPGDAYFKCPYPDLRNRFGIGQAA